jgi:hypothetical protein
LAVFNRPDLFGPFFLFSQLPPARRVARICPPLYGGHRSSLKQRPTRRQKHVRVFDVELETFEKCSFLPAPREIGFAFHGAGAETCPPPADWAKRSVLQRSQLASGCKAPGLFRKNPTLFPHSTGDRQAFYTYI